MAEPRHFRRSAAGSAVPAKSGDAATVAAPPATASAEQPKAPVAKTSLIKAMSLLPTKTLEAM